MVTELSADYGTQRLVNVLKEAHYRILKQKKRKKLENTKRMTFWCKLSCILNIPTAHRVLTENSHSVCWLVCILRVSNIPGTSWRGSNCYLLIVCTYSILQTKKERKKEIKKKKERERRKKKRERKKEKERVRKSKKEKEKEKEREIKKKENKEGKKENKEGKKEKERSTERERKKKKE